MVSSSSSASLGVGPDEGADSKDNQFCFVQKKSEGLTWCHWTTGIHFNYIPGDFFFTINVDHIGTIFNRVQAGQVVFRGSANKRQVSLRCSRRSVVSRGTGKKATIRN